MKVGSLVVVLKSGVNTPEDLEVAKLFGWVVKWWPVCDEETIYTIRDLLEVRGVPCARLEEGVVGYSKKDGSELCLTCRILKEIQKPMDLTEVVELANRELVYV